MQKTPETLELDDVNITCNFQLTPPSSTQLKNFNGVSLIFNYNNSGQQVQNMLYFAPNGVPNDPVRFSDTAPSSVYHQPGGGLNDATSKTYDITLAHVKGDGTPMFPKKTITIDKVSGIITVQ
jgi:hypothetical protein